MPSKKKDKANSEKAWRKSLNQVELNQLEAAEGNAEALHLNTKLLEKQFSQIQESLSMQLRWYNGAIKNLEIVRKHLNAPKDKDVKEF